MDENYQKGKRVTLIGAAANLILAAFKIFAGMVGMSAAMVADGVHSLSDLTTDVMVLLALRFSSRPKDAGHPYGHGKIESFGALGIGLILAAVGFEMFFDGITALMEGKIAEPTSLALIAAAVSIVVKEALYRYTAAVGKQTGQASLVANAWHHRTDALSSVAALLGIGGSMLGYGHLDRVAAIGVALFIVQAGARLGWQAFQDLIDAAIDEKTIAAIEKALLEFEEIRGFHALRARRLGSQILVDTHIQISADVSVAQGHSIAGKVKSRVMKIHQSIADVLVHIEPDTGCSSRPCLVLPLHQLERKIERKALSVRGAQSVTAINFTTEGNHCRARLNVRVDSALTIGEAGRVAENIRVTLMGTLGLTEVNVDIDGIDTTTPPE